MNERANPALYSAVAEWYGYLEAMKIITGNASNDMSFVAGLMAKDYLVRKLPMRSFDMAAKPQGASGLDIDERTLHGKRVVAEIKTTTPYGTYDLGAQQQATFKKDFAKLNAADADHKFFFVTDKRTFDLMKRKYSVQIPGVTIVLLPSDEEHTARS